MPTFFLSSAAGDDDPYVRQFFDDLRHHVPDSASSFLGTIGNGDRHPPPELLLRLASCDVFLALVSPRYLGSDACGRQWQAFADRWPPGEPVPTMVPLAWDLAAEPPPGLGPLLTPSAVDGDERDLRQLLRLRSLRERYHDFLRAVAERIITVAAAAPAPPAKPLRDLTEVASAFAVAASGPRVHFVIAAATRDEMDKVRRDVAYYGDEALAWTPYLPAAPESLASRARLLAADRALSAEVAALDDVPELIERARAAREIVVILCDWWLTRLDAYQHVLAEIDSRGLGDTALLVPASRLDDETTEHLAELRFGLRTTFRAAAAGPQSLVRSEVPSVHAFDADLAGLLEEARNRLFRGGGADASSEEGPLVPRPILRGP
ncbi:FxsC protein [Symbioplanes lichenis]|uniref:FxsC protein n=1 Tax=Symbioplanes lichenis TaxID=1629072 RepID=UPI002739A876|nr:FxsC protein [Actinoplanes lichenis]